MLRSFDRYFVTDISVQPIGHCPETSVTNYQSTLCNTTEERRPHLLDFVHCLVVQKQRQLYTLETETLSDHGEIDGEALTELGELDRGID